MRTEQRLNKIEKKITEARIWFDPKDYIFSAESPEEREKIVHYLREKYGDDFKSPGIIIMTEDGMMSLPPGRGLPTLD